MAYDSATPTALALRAYERANLTQQARRARLKQGYGLNDDGTLGSAGSIYQGNLDSVHQTESAELADRSRGFAGVGGLAGKRTTRANEAAQARQSGMLTDAFGNIAETTQGEQDNKGQYEDTLTQIRSNASQALAEQLAANPVQIPQSAPAPYGGASALGYIPAKPSASAAAAAARTAALKKKNPYATINNRY